MQNAAAGGIAVGAPRPNDAYRSVVSDLVTLIGHVQASLRLIERAIAPETSPATSRSRFRRHHRTG